MGKKSGFDLAEFRSIPLPTEAEIMAGWKGDPEQPVVSVLCTTYNQEMYIEDAIRGFLIQKTDFPFEVIINDDASTDSNAEIIKRYADKYPNIIKPVFQEVNQYSQGKKMSVLTFQHAKGKYIALCEGDDFWICKEKLHMEVEAATNSGCGLVFTSALVLREEVVSGRTGKCQNESGVIPLKAVIFGGASYCPTPSILIKREVMEALSHERWFLTAPVGDLYIQAFAAKDKGACYVDMDTCVYRTFARESWTAKKRTSEEISSSLGKTIDSIKEMSSVLGENQGILCSQMLGNAYYLHGMHYLKERNYDLFLDSMVQANKLMLSRSKGFRVFYSLRRAPKVAQYLSAHTIFR